MTNSCEISGIEPIFLYHSERFKSLYYWLWFLWISKCTKSDVWTMHVFPIQLHIWPACAKSLTDNASLQVGSIKKIMKYTMKIYGEVNTSVEGKHHIFCFLNSTWCTAKKTAMGGISLTVQQHYIYRKCLFLHAYSKNSTPMSIW